MGDSNCYGFRGGPMLAHAHVTEHRYNIGTHFCLKEHRRLNTEASTEHFFGGEWTKTKLHLLRRYLDAFTTALKNQPFELVYIDTHAGNGMWVPDDGPPVDGSPLIALSIKDKSFAELHLNDADSGAVEQLEQTIDSRFPGRNGVTVTCEDADVFVQRVADSMRHPKRGVVFVDPFNTRGFSWTSMRAIGTTGILDAIVLFPAGAVWRQMPNVRDDQAPHMFEKNLNRFFGDETWKKAYDPEYVAELAARHGIGSGVQSSMKGLGKESRVSHEYIPYIYKEKLGAEFAAVDLRPMRLEVTGQAYFEIIFAVSNASPAAQALAVKVFSGVVESLQ